MCAIDSGASGGHDGVMPDELGAGAAGADLRKARAQGRRLAHGFIAVIAVLFIGASTVQIVEAVFGADAAADAAAERRPDSDADRCARGVGRLVSIDRTAGDLAAVAEASGEDDAVARALAAKACAASPGGLDTWAALERLQVAREQLARRDRVDLEPLRRDVSAHLPADLR